MWNVVKEPAYKLQLIGVTPLKFCLKKNIYLSELISYVVFFREAPGFVGSPKNVILHEGLNKICISSKASYNMLHFLLFEFLQNHDEVLLKHFDGFLL